MDLTFSAAEEAFRRDCRAWLRENVPHESLGSGDTREGFARHVEWEKKLFAGGWAAVAWPRKYGGRDASLVEWLIFEEEYYRVGAPSRVTQNGIFMLAPILFEFGTEAQKDRLLRSIASAETLWAQGWSEPNAGSDLASLKSRAERESGGYRLTGQKTWCTRGAFCDGMFGLFRTDPGASPYEGLTYFLVPLDAPGVTVRPVQRLDGDEGFAEVFLDGVFVPDSDVIGTVNAGWKVAMATTNSERGLTLRSPGRFIATAERLLALYRRCSDPSSIQRHRDAVVRAVMDAEAYRLHSFQTVAIMEAGQSLGAKTSLSKIFWSELDVHMHETALALLGEDAPLVDEAGSRDRDAFWMKDYQFALAGPIYAGTNEIQRNVVAERVLGLPRK